MQQDINGVTLTYSLDGPADAPVLTLAHALSLDMRSWAPQIAFFRNRYRVLCFNLRGHAQTDVDGAPFSIEDLAGDVIGLLDHLNIDRTHFAGSSLGGMAGFALALDHPDRLASLTLLATQGVLPKERAQIQRENIAKMHADERGLALQVDAMLERLNRDGYRTDAPEGYAQLRDMATGGTVEGYERACVAIAAMNYDDRLGDIAAPTLVAAGSKDASTTPERMAIYGSDIPNARMSIIEGAAHFPNFDSPDAFNAVLDEFLTNL
ncbi:MAG: alpha/beta fold hydrolase [Alphaproteobacteria bacterium]|nr:alpha/beta fold hydrolase [Alphaproteobacteria bacterium]